MDPPQVEPSPKLARLTCELKWEPRPDGVIFVVGVDGHHVQVSLWNADGSPGGVSGNGACCIAQQLRDGTWCIDFGEAQVEVTVGDGSAAVTMGPTTFGPESVSVDADCTGAIESLVREAIPSASVGPYVWIGNPHLVVWTDPIDEPIAESVWRQINDHPGVRDGMNVHFVKRIDASSIEMTPFERGVGRTLGCGSGACAVVAAGQHTGDLADTVAVRMAGGEVRVTRADDRHLVLHVPIERRGPLVI